MRASALTSIVMLALSSVSHANAEPGIESNRPAPSASLLVRPNSPLPIPLASPASDASGEPVGRNNLHKFYLGVGILAYSFGSYSTEVTGKAQYQALVFQEFSIASRFESARFPRWAVVPLITFTPFGRKSYDGNETTRIVRFAGRGVYGLPLGPATIDFFSGLGVLNSIVSGAGGKVRLNNGNGFSEFGVPSDSSTTNLFYWEAGAGAQLAAFRWDNSILVTGALSSRRAWSLSSQLSVGVF